MTRYLHDSHLADPLVADEEEGGLLVGGGVVGVGPPLPVPGDGRLPNVVAGSGHCDPGMQLNMS